MPRPLVSPNCNKELLNDLIARAGFPSTRQFAIAIGLQPQSLWNNIYGTYGLSVDRVVKIANGLEVPLETVIEVFYPDLYESNKQYR